MCPSGAVRARLIQANDLSNRRNLSVASSSFIPHRKSTAANLGLSRLHFARILGTSNGVAKRFSRHKRHVKQGENHYVEEGFDLAGACRRFS
jgi:hypothetical protein